MYDLHVPNEMNARILVNHQELRFTMIPLKGFGVKGMASGVDIETGEKGERMKG
jgi:hypothetical protein